VARSVFAAFVDHAIFDCLRAQMAYLLRMTIALPFPPMMRFALLSFALIAALALPARAADRDKLEAFLNVTGFDVALESIRLTAGTAPQMIGMDPGAFGSEWTRLADDVFATPVMKDLALNILERTLSEDVLAHAASFYASELGQRLVVAENASHMMEDDDTKREEGTALVAQMVEDGAPRLELIKRMNKAIDVSDTSARALQEVQIRFLLSASAAGVVELRLDPDELRAMMKSQEGQMRRAIQQSALSGSAYTYRDFSDEDVERYAIALETPEMQELYELMNAVQFEIMANRFEVLAARMADLHPSQDI